MCMKLTKEQEQVIIDLCSSFYETHNNLNEEWNRLDDERENCYCENGKFVGHCHGRREQVDAIMKKQTEIYEKQNDMCEEFAYSILDLFENIKSVNENRKRNKNLFFKLFR